MAKTTLDVNGEPRLVEADPSTELLWVLRDELGLTAAKFSCGRGLCGACRVLVDGRPMPSCVVTVGAAASARITTLEGLSADGDHPVQRAWVEEDVAQCGYCQAGQILTAASLLEANPSPDDGEIAEAMSEVLCRCGTYPRIARAVRRAAREAEREAAREAARGTGGGR